MVLWRYKLFIFLLFMTAYGFLYQWPNMFPIHPPELLPLGSIDRAMPFLPWTFLIYVSDYAVFAVMLYLLDLENFNIFARRMFLSLFICGAFFFFLPTTYPRPEYPEHVNGVLRFLMWLIGSADTPHNCFPSMHVALTAVAAWSIRYRGRKTFAIFWIWSLSIFISTLTTKQHYVADIVGGLTVALVAITVEWALFQNKSLQAWLARVRSS